MGRMTPEPDAPTPARRLRPAIVLSTTEEACTVITDGQTQEIAYALPFPRPRAERVSPGHLVALTATPDGPDVVLWRWFDAVVIDPSGAEVTLWEPHHGTVLARPRNPQQRYRPGSRAYVSAGLPGADWWVAGPVVE